MKNLKIAIKDDTRDTYQEGYLLNVHIDTKAIVDLIYPVGSTITTLNIHFNPNVQYAGTTWTTIKEGVFLQSTQNSSEVGTEMSPGLPNIYGTFDGNTDDGSAAKTGAFYAPGWGFGGSNGCSGGGTLYSMPLDTTLSMVTQLQYNHQLLSVLYGNELLNKK